MLCMSRTFLNFLLILYSLACLQISRIEFIHSRHFVHRDIKPANFVMGTGKAAHLVNVIDFGLAKNFTIPAPICTFLTEKTVTMALVLLYSLPLIRTLGSVCPFSQIFQTCGLICIPFPETSRHDDLESLAYMLIYFLCGTLPWKKIKGSTVSETWDLIWDKKIETEPFLTVGLPTEFDVLYKYTRGLEFDDLPDYAGVRALFRSLAKKRNIDYDGAFDWTPRSDNKKKRFCHACNARHVTHRP
jgi:casein kinase I family protein HRR25